jgi:hypothetical protein
VLAEWTAAPPHANPWKALEQNYLHRFNSADWLLLAQCRQVALYGSRENRDKLLADLKRRIESAMELVPGEATLHLARGFVDIAEHNLTAAAHSFLTASVLAEWASSKTPDPQQLELFDGKQTRQPTEDAWSIAFAHAFLLDMLPSDWSRGAMFVPIDQFRLRLVRAALMRSQSAILPALQQYAAAIDELANQPRPHFYTIYKSYRIVAHQARFYAVPRSNGNFFISDGIVVRRSGLLDEVKPWLSERIDPRWRAFARRIWHRLRGFPYQIKCAVSDRLDPRSRAFARRIWRLLARPILRIMGRVTRGLSRRLRALLIRIYVKLLAARGVLIDTDVLALRERIDKRDTLARGQIVS